MNTVFSWYFHVSPFSHLCVVDVVIISWYEQQQKITFRNQLLLNLIEHTHIMPELSFRIMCMEQCEVKSKIRRWNKKKIKLNHETWEKELKLRHMERTIYERKNKQQQQHQQPAAAAATTQQSKDTSPYMSECVLFMIHVIAESMSKRRTHFIWITHISLTVREILRKWKLQSTMFLMAKRVWERSHSTFRFAMDGAQANDRTQKNRTNSML